jgi:hypothetical protein
MLMGALAAGLAALALSAAPASASPPMAASGIFHQDSINQTFVKQADGNLFFTDHDFASYTGTFNGSHVFDGTVEVFKDGRVSFHGVATFTGTVSGCGTGTVVLNIQGGVDTSGFTSFHDQTLYNKGTLPVHAGLDFSGLFGSDLPYTGSYSC